MAKAETKAARMFWQSMGVSLAIDAAIVAPIVYYFQLGAPWFFAIFIGWQIFAVALWFIRMAIALGFFWLFGTARVARGIEDFLYQNRFPNPDEYSDCEFYLGEVMNQEEAGRKTRLAAAVELGVINGLRASGNWLLLLRIIKAWETGMKLYERRFPPKQAEDGGQWT